MMRLFKKSLVVVLFSLGFTIQAFSSALWCEKTYEWAEKKNVFTSKYDDGSFTGLEAEIKDIKIYDSYDNTILDIYSKTTTDFILEYTNHKNKNKKVIIKGRRASKNVYADIKKHISNGINISKYLTCNEQYSNDLNAHIAYQITSLDINIKDGTTYTLTRGGTTYAFNHNVAVALSYFTSSISTATNSDDVILAITSYLATNINGGGYAIYLKLQNADNFFDQMKIATDETMKILEAIVADNEKYSYVIKAANILKGELENVNDKLGSDNPNHSEGKLTRDSLGNITLNILDAGMEEAFNKLFVYTGVAPLKQAAEALGNFLIASNVLMDMSKSSFTKIAKYESHKFQDIKFNSSKMSKAVYYLLSNHSIGSPTANRNYMFYKDISINAQEFATVIVNTFLYDDYKLQEYDNKLKYINDKFASSRNLNKRDSISLDTADDILKKVFALKINILAKDSSAKESIKKQLLSNWDKYNAGKGQILGLKNNEKLSRGNMAILIYATALKNWDKIINDKILNIKVLKAQKIVGKGLLFLDYFFQKIPTSNVTKMQYNYLFKKSIKDQ